MKFPKYLKIHTFPDPVLLRPTEPVKSFDTNLQNFIQSMFRCMYNNNGIGLAAPQVGVSLQIFVQNTTPQYLQRQKCFINPQILELSADAYTVLQEGCLSFPGRFREFSRPSYVKVLNTTPIGRKFEVSLHDLDAFCFLHEYDHLINKLIFDT